ncbi:YifB family Mg chelatase-like AAA ATPase [Bacillus carboniphilus]|uniref:YifB family Mg chelatase-like AAA ATPase n=1 Tax=Bacillus carboniphilus TaxID=86663 RepID=A0ABP3FLH7_9BACI
MATTVTSIGLKGLEGYRVQVEVQLIPGTEGITIVGLPDAAVKESKDRVMAALYANECELNEHKVVINLSPAEQKKNIPLFDVAMAIGIMKETGYIHESIPPDTAFIGVVSLDGTIRSVEGILPAIISAKKENIKTLYLPPIHDFPLEKLEGIELRFVTSLLDIVRTLSGQLTMFLPSTLPHNTKNSINQIEYERDFKQILGHSYVKRALEIAAAGGHNVLMSGPPGCGKSLLAETFPTILPMLSQDDQFEIMSIYQLAGEHHPSNQWAPFRHPHHSASSVSLIGGGSNPKPGEVSLAHNGVLFLDEMAEFPKKTLDMLRQPIENGKVTISRVSSTVTYPARFILVGAMNPCPCGYLGARDQYCTCTPKQINQYHNRLSGPIRDRLDILLNLQPVRLQEESLDENETSETIRGRVLNARIRQASRYGNGRLNANAPLEELLKDTPLTGKQSNMLQQWSSKRNWSNRVQIKLIRLARTISDLNGSEMITDEALWEALTLRKDKMHNEKMVGRLVNST